MGRDAMEFGQRYAYANQNPVLYVDPLGLCGWRDPWDCPVDLVTTAGDLLTSGGSAVDDFLRMEETILALDAFAIGANTFADTATTAGLLAGPGGSAAVSVIVAPARIVANAAGVLGAYGTCRNEGLNHTCALSATRAATGAAIPASSHTSASRWISTK